MPANIALFIELHCAFTIVNLVDVTEPLEMGLNQLKEHSWEISKSCSRINHHCEPITFRATDLMIVHSHTIQPNFKV